MNDLISRKALCDYALNQKDKSVTPNDIMRFPSAQPVDKDINVPVKDCISRRAAIDALFELYEYQRDIDSTEAADLVRQGIYLAEKKIEQLPSAQPQWIPCSKKLPEKEGPYLVSNSWRTFEAMFLEGEWYSRKLDLLLDGVLAWMHLPEPYKGGQNERQEDIS